MQPKPSSKTREIGHISSYYCGVGKITGLPHVFLHETLLDENGSKIGLVIGFDEDFVEAVFFKESLDIQQPVFRSNKIFSIPFSADYIGRVVDGTGKPIDSLGTIEGEQMPVFREAPAIIDRKPVEVAISTGIKLIDTTLPIGRGQRELIIGDRKLGKSTLAIDTVLNQADVDPEVYCVYVVCGQKKKQLEDILDLFRAQNTFAYSVVVAATADDSFAAQYLAPFVGSTIAEYFRDNGKDALVVYDDLSKHAKTYRDISLLLERAPGREAYPGDIFSLHAKLLERPAKLSKENGGGSLTALPIIETEEGDISAFISTNIISITDGQIYLERGLFQKGYIPAVNVGLSVSRIGSKVQPEVLQEVTGGIRLALSQHQELQKLAQLETKVSQEAMKKVHRGELTLELLKQGKHAKVSWEYQVILFYAVQQGYFDEIEKEKWSYAENLLLEFVKTRYADVLMKIKAGKFDDAVKEKIREIVEDFKQNFYQESDEDKPAGIKSDKTKTANIKPDKVKTRR